jgi:hypothetical protein
VDLTGFTQHGRLGIFALRPVPIQVSYLGYLGTTSAEYSITSSPIDMSSPQNSSPATRKRLSSFPKRSRRPHQSAPLANVSRPAPRSDCLRRDS